VTVRKILKIIPEPSGDPKILSVKSWT